MGGVPTVTMTSCNAKMPTESYLLRTVPVWMKANGRKVKIAAILDDTSNETFLNEEVAGVVLGLQEPFQKVQFHLLNPLTPVLPVTGLDKPWPFFHF